MFFRHGPTPLDFILWKLENIMSALDDLAAKVSANTDVVQSAITLLGTLKTELDAAIASAPDDDGEALQALSDKLGSDDSALAAAVAANTPAAAPVADEPAPLDNDALAANGLAPDGTPLVAPAADATTAS